MEIGLVRGSYERVSISYLYIVLMLNTTSVNSFQAVKKIIVMELACRRD